MSYTHNIPLQRFRDPNLQTTMYLISVLRSQLNIFETSFHIVHYILQNKLQIITKYAANFNFAS